MKKTIILLLCMALFAFGIKAQESISLTLQEAQDYALQHNKALLNAREDVMISQAQLKEAISQGLPQVSGSFDYMTNFNYEAELKFGGSGEGTIPDIDYGLLDAGDLEILNALSQYLGGSTGPAVILMEDQANARVQVSQLLFNAQYWIGIQAAKIARQISEQNLSRTELDIKESVISTYYLILISERSLDIINQNIENLNGTLKHTEDMYKAGLLESTDVDQIRINVSQLQNARNSMERTVQLGYNMLRLQLGLEPGVGIDIRESFSDLATGLEDARLMAYDFDMSRNPTYQIMESQALLSEKMVNMNRWAYAPTISGYYSYTEKILTTGFDISPKNAAGLTVSLPIFSGGMKKSQIDQAKIEYNKAQRSKSLLEDQLTLQKNQLLFEYRNALDNYFTQKESVEVALRVFESNNNKFRQGMLSSLDLTQANSNYLQAENNYVSSVMSLLQAKLALQKLYNTI